MEEIDLRHIRGPYKFQEMCNQLVVAEFHKAKAIEGSGGDEGIDAYIGEFSGEITTVFQHKYFTGRLSSSQKKQIEKSLETVHEKHAIQKWILCIAKDFTPSEQKWFDSLEKKYPNTKMDYWNASKIKSLLLTYLNIRESYFPQIDSQRIKEIYEKIVKEEEIIEEGEYIELSLDDASYTGAKRYAANLLINSGLSKESIKKIIKDTTEEIKNRQFYRNELVKQRWDEKPAQVVWLYVYESVKDVPQANWICRTSWIDKNLDESFRPVKFVGNDKINGIDIEWNENYQEFKRFYEKRTTTKEGCIENIKDIWNPAKKLIDSALDLTEKFEADQISSREYISKMQKNEKRFRELYLKSGGLPFPPIECTDYDQSFQNIMALGDNIFLPFSKEELSTWEEKDGMFVVRDNIKNYLKEVKRFNFEREKIII